MVLIRVVSTYSICVPAFSAHVSARRFSSTVHSMALCGTPHSFVHFAFAQHVLRRTRPETVRVGSTINDCRSVPVALASASALCVQSHLSGVMRMTFTLHACSTHHARGRAADL